MSRHDLRVTELIAHEAAVFIAREATNQSLITVTRAMLSTNAEHVTVFVSVFPQTATGPAIAFLERETGAFRTHLAKNSRLKPVPRIDFVLDEGELNRQHLDDLTK